MRVVPEGIHSIDPFRLIPSACSYVAPFISNGKFIQIAGTEGAFVDGKLGFTRGEEKPDGCYKSMFFPCYDHSGVVYQSDDNGLELAFNYRLGCARIPKSDVVGDFTSYDDGVNGSGYHNLLLLNQDQFFKHNSDIRSFKTGFEIAIHDWFAGIGDLDERLISYAQQPHPKRILRMRALRSVLEGGDFFHPTFNRKVTGKVKRAEIAKFNKATRLINDLTCEGSLLAGFVTDQIKQCMAAYTKDHWFQFVKSPNLTELQSVFRKLIDPTGSIYFPFFSDDSCVSIRCVDGVFMANVDISSCDGSHSGSIFEFFRAVTQKDNRLNRFVNGAIMQCQMALTLTSAGSHEWVRLKPNAPTLYSGSCLTTVINNIANIAIACAIKTAYRDDLLMSECEKLVRTAAMTAGYVVTVVVCDTYHDLQLLKHSPCIAECGTLVPVLNIGVILRSSGCCWGDLPTYKDRQVSKKAKLTFAERAYLYNVSQTQCYSNCPTSSFLAKMRDKYKSPTKVFRPNNAFHYLIDMIEGDFSGYVVPDAEFATRYKISDSDFLELSDTVADGVMSNIIASRAILALDYGL